MGFGHSKPGKSQKTRAQSAEDRRDPISLPELNWGWHLIEAIRELGWCVSGFGGAEPLPWSEIDAYARRSWPDMGVGDARTIREMSEAFVQAQRHGADDFAMSPMEVLEEEGRWPA